MNYKEFNYSSITQRRLMLLSLFLTTCTILVWSILGIFYLTTVVLYYPIWKYILTFCCIGLFLGSIAGNSILPKLHSHRGIIIIQEILLTGIAIAPVIGLFMFKDILPMYVYILKHCYWLVYLSVFMMYFFAGFKAVYYLKTTIGDYTDNKNPAIAAVIITMLSIICAVIISSFFYYQPHYYALYALFPLTSLILTLFLSLPFCPPAIISRGSYETTHPPVSRDDILFTYCNVSFICIFILLMCVTIFATYGFHIDIIFYTIVIMSVGCIIGVVASKILPISSTIFIYGEMLYPFLFLGFLIIVYSNYFPYYGAISAALPFCIFSGITFGTSLQHILFKKNHQSRYMVLFFSLIIIPVPILIVFLWIELSYVWFFILIYAIAIVTIIFPGMYLLQNTKRSLPSILYFIVSLLFIPAIITMHIYFKLPFSNSLVNQYCSGYESIRVSNFNASFITQPATASIQGIPACIVTDYTARDMKRAIVLASLFSNSTQTIIIDGYHKFFTNKFFSILHSPIILDYIPDRIVDFKKPTITGVEHFAAVYNDIIKGLAQKKGTIIDIPNIFDHYMYPFRFSDTYIAEVKNHVEDYYFIILDVAFLSPQRLANLTKAIQNNFTHYVIVISGNQLMIGATDKPNGFVIGQSELQQLENVIHTTDASTLFVNAEHALSYVIDTSLQFLIQSISTEDKPFIKFHKPENTVYPNTFIETVVTTNEGALNIADTQGWWVTTLRMRLLYAKRINQLLKQSEYYGLQGEYEAEMKSLMELRRMGEYTPQLRNYITLLIGHKEKLFEHIALQYEKEKLWDKAIALYSAMLAVNPNNFTANYRIGIISATIQNLDNAFKYLNNAMRMNPSNPEVLYQLGILLVSQGNYAEALHYLLKAHQMNMATASLFFNIGLCYESLKNLEEAKRYYEKAKLLDPNDPSIQSSLERVSNNNKTFNPQTDTRTNQLDEEKGESFPLPINQSAYDVRLKDNEIKDQDKANTPQ